MSFPGFISQDDILRNGIIKPKKGKSLNLEKMKELNQSMKFPGISPAAIGLYINDAGEKGRGVFTTKAIKPREVIERSSVIEISREEHHQIAGNILERYVFLWDKRKKSIVVVLGFGSLYNHSNEPNASYKPDFKNRIMTFRATRDILPDEEITIHYGPSGEQFNQNQM